jgi:branched-chain amino acid transport system substrate-binding protein
MRRSKLSRIGMAWSLLLACGLLLGGFKAPAAAAPEPYKIGVVLAVTGVGSFLGAPAKKTVEMVAADVNKAGGINGHPLELILIDDESDATKSNLAFKKLIKTDDVPVIIGPSRTGESLADVGVAEQFQVPMLSLGAAITIITPPDKRKWVFKLGNSDSHVVGRMYEYMQAKGIKKIGIMADSTAFGASGRDELLKLAPQYGITVAADERFGPQDTDLTPQLTKIRATGPQAVVSWSIGPTQVVSVKNWRDLGMEAIPLYQSHGFANLKNVQLAGKAAEGVLLPVARTIISSLLPDSDPQKAVVAAYAKEYEAQFKEPVSTFGGHAWDGMQLAMAALKAVGPDRAKIRDFIEKTKGFVGCTGIFNFTPEDHCGMSKDALVMVVVKNGTWALAP